MSQAVIGWVDAWTSPYRQIAFTEERKRALIDRIRKRGYNFTYEAHQTLPYCAPFYQDKVLCVLTKQQLDEVIAEAYSDVELPQRCMPMDVLTIPPKNGVLYEKEKFMGDEAYE